VLAVGYSTTFPNVDPSATVLLVVEDVDVLVLLVLLVLELLDVVVLSEHAWQALPMPIATPPADTHRSWSATTARSFPGRQHTTADGRPQVECAAQRTTPRDSSPRQRLRRSRFRKCATQRTYCPWLSAVSHGQAAASAAPTSAGHGTGPGFPRRAIAPAGSAERMARAIRRRDARIVDLRGGSVPELLVRAVCQARHG
jgi:hypothetical protein